MHRKALQGFSTALMRGMQGHDARLRERKKQRLFVAVDLPDVARRALTNLQKGLSGIRWTSPDSLHLTVRFIGETPLTHVPAIKAGLENVLESGWVESFSLQVSGLGFFDKRPQAVLWAGVVTSAELSVMKNQIDAALERFAGLQVPAGRFSPHITLGKMKQTDRKALRTFVTGNEAAILTTFPVRSFTLFSSVLAPGGAVHTVEAQYNLGNFLRNEESYD